MLIVELKSGQEISQIQPIPVEKETLKENVILDLVFIPAGKFLMGSPPDEVDRDWYQKYYPETNNLDVEGPQHQVKVQPFWISQYPITQSQWRMVANLPRLERDLVLDPSNFKGDQRPVESVSWDEAMEFCTRLSYHTKKTYRLPTEAEWEYACRAGTIAPFHFGKDIIPDLENYNGNFTYGNFTYADGATVKYRQATTDTGSFGVVNAFGLADLHGNVLEWCLDYWHPTYAGAPTDGSAWLADGYKTYRVARGGSWNNYPSHCRSAARHRYYPDYRNNNVGFRIK
jgi:formylglycine-generating enzyme required for sulfatase activity